MSSLSLPNLKNNFTQKEVSSNSKTNKSRKYFSNRYLHKLQKRHFIFLNLIPLFFTLIAFSLIPIRPPNIVDLTCLFLLWGFTESCIVVGFHRFFTHRSFKANIVIKKILQIGGLMAGQGGLVSWVALHRRHHECSDKPGDPHSPQHGFNEKPNNKKILKGILHAQFFWMKKHDYPNVMFYASELCRDKDVILLDKFYIHFVIFGILLPGIISFALIHTIEAFLFGILWGGFVRLFIVSASIGAVNSLLHTYGTRRFNTPDNSRNSAAFSLLTFGDSYHNNHHAFPRSASAALEAYKIDPAFWIIKALEKIGMTWDVYVPNQKRIEDFTNTTRSKRKKP